MKNIKVKRRRAFNILPYAFVLVTSFILCLGFCKFVVTQFALKNVEITRSISSSVLIAEHYIDRNLKTASIAFDLYLDSHFRPKTTKQMREVADMIGVDNVVIYNNKGRLEASSTGNKERNPDHWLKYSRFNTCPHDRDMMKEYRSFASHPFGNQAGKGASVALTGKGMTYWNASRNAFLNTYIETTNLRQILVDNIKIYNDIDALSVTTPAGVTIIDTKVSGYERRVSGRMVDYYEEKPFIADDINSMTVSVPFGGLRESCGKLQTDTGLYAKQANNVGQYFYVMNVTFNKAYLYKQLVMVVVVFAVLCILGFLLVHYIKSNSVKSNKIRLLSRDDYGLVKALCNERLLEIKKYLAKSVHDSRIGEPDGKSSKETLDELSVILDRAFKDIDEEDLHNINLID